MKINLFVIVGLIAAAGTAFAAANPARDAILAALGEQAKQADPTFAGFSADRGGAFWTGDHAGGKGEATSCTACHTKDPTAMGTTKAGKAIDPMAVSKTPARFTDAKKVAKWFLRNCNTVLGRECTSLEKGDIITYLSSK